MAQVERQAPHAVADLGGDTGRALRVAAGDHDRVSPRGELLGDGPADAGRPPDDDRVALAQVQED